MLSEQIINGDHCLIYPISEENPIQLFHVGMLTTNPEVRAVPFQCTYIEGKESILFKIHHLIPIKKVVASGRGTDLADLMRALGESIQELISYQLMPENMVLTEDCLYVDESFKRVYIVYLPLKNGLYDAKGSLTELILKWMDLHLASNVNTVHPLFVQLMLKLRQDQISFRSLLEILTKNAESVVQEPMVQPVHKEAAHFSPEPSLKAASMPIKLGLLKMPSLPEGLSLKIKSVIIPLTGILMSLLIMIFAPFELSTKAGLGLILVAITLAVHQKTRKVSFKKDEKNSSQADKSIKPQIPVKPFNNHTSDSTPEPVGADTFAAQTGYGDETVLIRSHNPAAVLMVRGEEGANYYSITKEIVTIGRNPSLCDLLLDETGIGRVHAEVHSTQGKYYIKDLQSLNGTYVNGRRITSSQYFELKSGDLIKIGQREVVFS